MENFVNRINQVMTLADGGKYVVIKQAIYKDESYFVTAKLSEEEKLLDEFVVFKEIVCNEHMGVQEITDIELIKLICKYVGLLETKNDLKGKYNK